ncbi:membrane protein insertase YidC [Rheinheimera sp. WS51]|uniref:membrane protein insertase YidC n=1 Tax=Rheinheimera sp. WS51 TaxID=3425886 RepID=UPI003D8ED3B3
MESQRSLLVIGLALVSFLLWQQWQIDHAPQAPTTVSQSNSSPNSSADIGMSSTPSEQAVISNTAAQAKIITINTDVLQLQIDSRGGDIIGLKLPKYTVSKESDELYTLMRKLPNFQFVAQSGLIGRDGPDDNRNPRPVYTTTADSFTLAKGEQQLVVPLMFSSNGLSVEKRFIFTAGNYDVRVEYLIHNQSDEVKSVQSYQHLVQSIEGGAESGLMMPIYRGGAFGTAKERYTKYAFDDMQDENLRKHTTGGWAAMLEHYFVSAWVPDQQAENEVYSRVQGNLGVIGTKGPEVHIQPGESQTIAVSFYAGPKTQDNLAKLANGLDLTVDYGILWFISQPLFWLLTTIQGFVVNWGVAIICITLIVKGAMYPLTKIQYESMAKMRNLKPKIDELQARYKEDKQKMGPAMMELYRKEKVNPMGGCLPMIVQMPIFLALYWVFVESVELRHAPFALWITDLSSQDPFYVLPVLFGISMFLMQKLQPMTVTDPMQQKIMMWMPVAFSIFFLWFPSGLVLYWLVSNLISLAQMLYIYKGMEKKGLHTKKAKTS